MSEKARAGAPPGSREGDRRKTILRAAIEVFAKKGYHGCRIADVAREAGVAYGLVYHYFQNKEELLQSVFETGWTSFVGRLRVVAEGEATLEEKVRGITAAAFEAYRVDPRAVKVLILEIGRSPAGGRVNRGNAFAEVMGLLTAMFTTGQGRGELAPGADPVMCSALLFGAIEMGLTSFVVGLFDRKKDEALELAKAQVAEAFLHGVLQAPGAEITWKKDRSSIKPRAARRS
ncbi:MAG: TetR/AcrR family transcriptional regulator [Myxococcaceae bacterium]